MGPRPVSTYTYRQYAAAWDRAYTDADIVFFLFKSCKILPNVSARLIAAFCGTGAPGGTVVPNVLKIMVENLPVGLLVLRIGIMAWRCEVSNAMGAPKILVLSAKL